MRFITVFSVFMLALFGVGMSVDSPKWNRADTISLTGLEIQLVEEVAARGFSSSRSSFSSKSYSRSNRSSGSLWGRSSRSKSSGYSRSGSSSKKSGTSSTRDPSSGYTRSGSSSSTTNRTTTGSASSSGYSRSSSATTRTPTTTRRTPPTAASRAIQQRQASTQITRQRSDKFERTSTNRAASASIYRSNPVVSRVERTTPRRYYQRRDTFYDNRGWDAPSYVYAGAPSYGAFDALFLYMMLDNINDNNYAQWAASNRNDPGFEQWRAEAERKAAENEELRSKLNVLDRQLAANQSVSPGSVTEIPGVPADVMVAADLATAPSEMSLTCGAGSTAGMYHAFCSEIATQAAAVEGAPKVTVRNFPGSLEIMDALAKGQIDAGMVQSNVWDSWKRKNPGIKLDGLQAEVYPEVVFMLVNEQADVSHLDDVRQNQHNIYLAGSGSATTLNNWILEDRQYRWMQSKATNVQALEPSLQRLATDPNGVLLYVCALRCPFIKMANDKYGDKLDLAIVEDSDFNDRRDADGNLVYTFVDIPEEEYGKLLESGGWISSGDVETLAVDAVFVVHKAWADAVGVNGMANFESAVFPAMEKIQEMAGIPQ